MVDLAIDHPSVSLRHAKVFRRGDRAYVVDLKSFSGTFINGVRVWHETELPTGSRLAIGPVQLSFDGTSLSAYTEPLDAHELVCNDVGRRLRGRTNRDSRTILAGVSFAIRPCELVCVIGPSGSGKSTLLSILSGRVKPDSGSVLYRGQDLHDSFDSLKHDIAAVPQREAIHYTLTARQALYYATALRSPSDTTTDELHQRVDSLLSEVGLRDRCDVRIRDLSGGQLRRISLACEIAHRPRLILLDEVTSGLDELGDLEVMQLARSLAAGGRSIVCITHNTLNIERTAHRVIVLAPGGHLAHVGTPREACNYFRITRLGDTYAALARKPGAEWGRALRGNALATESIAASILTPASDSPPPHDRLSAAGSMRRPLRAADQVRLLTARSLVLQRMDPRAAAFAVAQAIFISVLLVAFFGDLRLEASPTQELANNRNAAFLLLISAFWLGCNNSAAEIAKERMLFERERAVSVSPTGYFISKLIVLGTIAVLQSLCVFAALSELSHLPADGGLVGCLRRIAVVGATGILGTVAGLAISAVAASEQVAIRAVPMLMISQIVLADALTPLTGWLERFAPAIITTYWSFRAFCAHTPGYVITDQAHDVSQAATMLAVHAIVATVVATIGLRRQAT